MRVFSNTAISLDGKIATRLHDHVFLGSDEDRRRMSLRRSEAHAVFVGGATFRAWPIPCVEREPQLPARLSPLLNVVLTRGDAVDALATRPARWPDPRVRLVFLGPSELASRSVPPWVEIRTTESPTVRWALDQIGAMGAENVLVEGGGALLFELLEADALDEMFVTLCPTVVGGATSKTLVDGVGFDRAGMRRLELLQSEAVADEVYLHYRVRRGSDPQSG